jgi:hypothetical protein
MLWLSQATAWKRCRCVPLRPITSQLAWLLRDGVMYLPKLWSGPKEVCVKRKQMRADRLAASRAGRNYAQPVADGEAASDNEAGP